MDNRTRLRFRGILVVAFSLLLGGVAGWILRGPQVDNSILILKLQKELGEANKTERDLRDSIGIMMNARARVDDPKPDTNIQDRDVTDEESVLTSVILAKETDPALAAAWKWDYYDLENRKTGDRDKAREAYERYLQDHPDSPLKSDIYHRIAYLYSGRNRSEIGEKKDYKVAHEYFTKLILEAPDEVSSYTLDARINRASIAPTMPQKVIEDVEAYQWLQTVTPEQVERTWNFSPGQRSYPKAKKYWLDVALKRVERSKRTVTNQMLMWAVSKRNPDPAQSLKYIMFKLRSTPPAAKAKIIYDRLLAEGKIKDKPGQPAPVGETKPGPDGQEF